MALTEARKGEIALLLLKRRARQEGVRIGPHIMREVGNTAKEIGIPVAEARQFMEEIVRELLNETFGSH